MEAPVKQRLPRRDVFSYRRPIYPRGPRGREPRPLSEARAPASARPDLEPCVANPHPKRRTLIVAQPEFPPREIGLRHVWMERGGGLQKREIGGPVDSEGENHAARDPQGSLDGFRDGSARRLSLYWAKSGGATSRKAGSPAVRLLAPRPGHKAAGAEIQSAIISRRTRRSRPYNGRCRKRRAPWPRRRPSSRPSRCHIFRTSWRKRRTFRTTP